MHVSTVCMQDLLPREGGVHAAGQRRHAHPGGGGRSAKLCPFRAGPGWGECSTRTRSLPGAQLPAVGGRDPAAEHPGSRPHLRTAAGAPADHSGEVHHLQGPGELFPAQVSSKIMSFESPKLIWAKFKCSRYAFKLASVPHWPHP